MFKATFLSVLLLVASAVQVKAETDLGYGVKMVGTYVCLDTDNTISIGDFHIEEITYFKCEITAETLKSGNYNPQGVSKLPNGNFLLNRYSSGKIKELKAKKGYRRFFGD